jgi:malate dehydrogenase (oxaloacetate-decarboxylating)(NADP+)
MTSPIDSQQHLPLSQAALEYHQFPTPGKLSVIPSKHLSNQRDLALAYSPGVAAACHEIVADPSDVTKYTIRGNLIAVITNGTAVLGLGNIGPLAAKPVMEGKAVLFKKFAGIDVFDLEIAESNPDKLCDIIAALEPTFGGINLEDIKSPECFYIERQLTERMKIPVFHDDQHGTAIIVAAAILNGLKIVNKDFKHCKLAVSGAGAAALACLNLLVDMGFPLCHIFVTDIEGVVYQGRTVFMDDDKARFAQETSARTLADIMVDADIFLGLSVGGIVTPEMILSMANQPLILALANPTPEIMPEAVKMIRCDAIMATGRSDYPNQVNNALCFPYIFRGALDCGASCINLSMKIAAVHAIAELAQAEQSDVIAKSDLAFGADYLIPLPFDPRLMIKIAPAIAQAAAQSGVATRPIDDMQAYISHLQEFSYHSGAFMRPIFQVIKNVNPSKKRIVFAEGEDERVLRALQIIVDEKIASPILIGRPEVLEQLIKKYGLRLKAGTDFQIVQPELNEHYEDYCQTYLDIAIRKGVSEQSAKIQMRKQHTLIGAMMVLKNHADGMICGTIDTADTHLNYIDKVLGQCDQTSVYAAMNVLILPERQVAIVDTHINEDPTAAELADITLLAVERIRQFGLVPRVALLSHSNFGMNNTTSAVKMRTVRDMVHKMAPDLEIDGEMHADIALDFEMLKKTMPHTPLKGSANLLVLPNIEAASISYNLLKVTAGNGISIGPILLGCQKPVHILTQSSTVRRIVNMTALCVLDID